MMEREPCPGQGRASVALARSTLGVTGARIGLIAKLRKTKSIAVSMLWTIIASVKHAMIISAPPVLMPETLILVRNAKVFNATFVIVKENF